MAKLIAYADGKQKRGKKTRSVGVNPCQWACCSGE